jgi:hypothetical protein
MGCRTFVHRRLMLRNFLLQSLPDLGSGSQRVRQGFHGFRIASQISELQIAVGSHMMEHGVAIRQP